MAVASAKVVLDSFNWIAMFNLRTDFQYCSAHRVHCRVAVNLTETKAES